MSSCCSVCTISALASSPRKNKVAQSERQADPHDWRTGQGGMRDGIKDTWSDGDGVKDTWSHGDDAGDKRRHDAGISNNLKGSSGFHKGGPRSRGDQTPRDGCGWGVPQGHSMSSQNIVLLMATSCTCTSSKPSSTMLRRTRSSVISHELSWRRPGLAHG